MLGNTFDFSPQKNSVEYSEMKSLDKFMLHKLALLNTDVQKAYEDFSFYKVFHLIHNFCTVELSSLYLDIAKDTLYTNKKDSVERRSMQTVMYNCMDTIVKLLAPILPFTT